MSNKQCRLCKQNIPRDADYMHPNPTANQPPVMCHEVYIGRDGKIHPMTDWTSKAEMKPGEYRFVQLEHLVPDGQKILFRVNDQGSVCQFLEWFSEYAEEGEPVSPPGWHAVAGIASGIPIDYDIIKLVAQRKFVKDITVISYTWNEDNTKHVNIEEPADDYILRIAQPEITVAVKNVRGEYTMLKYERVEPPECDDIKLYGHNTLAEGYYTVEDDGRRLNTTPPKPEPLPN